MALTTAAKGQAGNGLGGRTQIVSAPVADQGEYDAIIEGFGATGTVAGADGAHGGTVHFAIQQTADVAGTVAGITVTAVCDFKDNV
tara:strand:+ start:12209 stop:12466 length:258 start_codon:yes stop_codon:yes gene_type:complete